MNQPTKNGLPWTGLYKFPEPVKSEYLTELKRIWDSVDWGTNYENNRRGIGQTAIYPHTRTIHNSPYMATKNKDVAEISALIAKDVAKLFPIPMTAWQSELTLLLPKGVVPWHYDRMRLCSWSTRVMVPFTDNGEDIKNYFCSWKSDIPDVLEKGFNITYCDNDVSESVLHPGYYYAFNFRVPHKTVSFSDLPRGLLQIDLAPIETLKTMPLADQKLFHEMVVTWGTTFQTITEFEKTPLLPNLL
jgi:hypothetical protein